MILVTYRHGLRASEVCDLQWHQVELDQGRMHVRRAKNGTPSVHPIRGDEIRALRKLRRESPTEAYNPSGGRPGSRHRQQLNGEFIAALLRDFRHGGPKAIERVRRTQPAAYLKILALLVPREHKVEHSNPIKDLTDEQLEAAIEYIEAALAAKAGDQANVIEARVEPAALQAPELELQRKRPSRLLEHADTAIGPRERKPRKVPSPAST